MDIDIESRFKKLERTLKVLMQRSGKKHFAMVTPIPLMFKSIIQDTQGELASAIIPSSGKIISGYILFESVVKKVTIKVEIINGSGLTLGGSYEVSGTKVTINGESFPPISAGSFIKITALSSDESIIGTSHTSLLFRPEVSQTEIEDVILKPVEDLLIEKDI